MSDDTVRLFVYGTLMPDQPNHWQIEAHVRASQPGTIEGILVDLGAFPAFIPGHGIVKGIVLELDAAALEITDRVEGYHPDRDRCLYVRKEVTVSVKSGEEETAWTYVFANPDSIADYPRLVVDESDGKPVSAWSRG